MFLRSLFSALARRCALAALLAFAAPSALAQNAADGYTPLFDGSVHAIVVQADGKALYGGAFSQVNGQPCRRLCRLRVDGRVDPGFADPNIDGAVRTIALQADGRILVGGEFTHVAGNTRGRVARLNANGSFDASFADPAATTGTYVNALVVQADGRILVSGGFTTIGGQPRNALARLNANGTLDTGFANPIVSGYFVSTLAVLADGRILIGGNFLTVAGQPRRRVARLDANGGLDPGFADPMVGGSGYAVVVALAVEANGKVLIGGSFDSVGGVARGNLARLDANGSLDTYFQPAASSYVSQLIVRPDYRIVVVGDFGSIGGAARKYVAQLWDGGDVDLVFADPAVQNRVLAAALQPDGKLLIGGDFTAVGTQPRQGVARLNAGGSLDTDFIDTGAGGEVFALAVRNNNDTLLVGGTFTSIGGTTRKGVARLLSNGAVDTSFADAGANGEVLSLNHDTDGSYVLVGGGFSQIRGEPRHGLAALYASNGAIVPSFVDPQVAGTVFAVDRNDDDKILIGGDFATVGGQARAHLARLNFDGSLDTGFVNPGVIGSAVMTIAQQPDGKLLIGGPFKWVGLSARIIRNGAARLNADGSLDHSFANPEVVGPDTLYGSVMALAVLKDGRVLIGGGFDHVGGQPRKSLALLKANGSLEDRFVDLNPDGMVTSIAVQADGKMWVSGNFTTIGGYPYKGIARLHPVGSVDTSFVDPGANGAVYALAQQSDGKLLAGGDFTTIGGKTRSRIARLSLAEAALQSCEITGTTYIWRRDGTAPELAAAPWINTDSASGFMTRIPGGWQFHGGDLPIDDWNYFNAYGRLAGGAHSASHGGTHYACVGWASDRLFADGFE